MGRPSKDRIPASPPCAVVSAPVKVTASCVSPVKLHGPVLVFHFCAVFPAVRQSPPPAKGEETGTEGLEPSANCVSMPVQQALTI